MIPALLTFLASLGSLAILDRLQWHREFVGSLAILALQVTCILAAAGSGFVIVWQGLTGGAP